MPPAANAAQLDLRTGWQAVSASAADAAIAFLFFAMPLIMIGGEATFLILAVWGIVLMMLARGRLFDSADARLTGMRAIYLLAGFMALLWLLKAASLAWAMDPPAAARDVKTHLHLLLFLPLVAVFARAKTPWAAAITGIAASLPIVGAWALVHIAQHHDLASNRFEAGAQNALVLATLLCVYCLWTLVAWLGSGQRWLLVSVALGWLSVAVAAGRTPFVVLAALSLVLLTWHYRRSVAALIAALVIVLAVTGAVFASGELALGAQVQRAADEVSAFEEHGQVLTSVGNRLELWQVARQAIAAAPLLGHGANSSTALVNRYAPGKSEGMFKQHFHNQFLQIAAELGLTGLLCLLALLWAAWRATATGAPPVLARSAALFVAAMVLMGMTNIFLKQGLLNTFFVSALALLCAVNLQANQTGST